MGNFFSKEKVHGQKNIDKTFSHWLMWQIVSDRLKK